MKFDLKLHLSLTEGFENVEQRDKLEMKRDLFREELMGFNSPDKTRGRITTRNSEARTPGLNLNYTFFNKIVPKSRKNSEIMRKKSFGFGLKATSEFDSKSQSGRKLKCPSSTSNSMRDPLDLDVASEVQDMALEIFDNVFNDVYEQNKYQTQDGQIYITKEQYEEEMKAMGEEDDDFDDDT